MGQYKRYKFKERDDNRILEAISGWIPIKNKQVTQKHRLFDQAESENEYISATGKRRARWLWYFEYCHQEYSINQIDVLHYPIFFEDENEKLSHITGVVVISNTINFFVEMDDVGENVRLFLEKECDEYGRNIA